MTPAHAAQGNGRLCDWDEAEGAKGLKLRATAASEQTDRWEETGEEGGDKTLMSERGRCRRRRPSPSRGTEQDLEASGLK